MLRRNRKEGRGWGSGGGNWGRWSRPQRSVRQKTGHRPLVLITQEKRPRIPLKTQILESQEERPDINLNELEMDLSK